MDTHKQLPLVIWGASGHALVVADIVRLLNVYTIVGFLDDITPNRSGAAFCGATVLGGREQLDLLMAHGVEHVLLGFGSCRMRYQLTTLLRNQGFSLPIAVHPQAVVAKDAIVGAGTVVAAGAVVNPASKIGSSVIVNTCASIDHECTIDDAAHIGPGARLAGRVSIGREAQIGIGATVIDGISIGKRAIIGAGAVVVRDIPDDVVAYGAPARIKRAIN